jgi:hypothetical protein
MKKVANLIVMSFLLTIVGCSEPLANYEAFDRSESPKTSSSESEVENQKISVQELKIIKEGSLAFECTSLEETRDLINEAVKKTGAYISNENITTFPERAEQSLEIRVPAENFDTLVSQISQGVTQFENKNIRVLDVTEDYIDTQSRLEVKKALELRYQELLSQAKTVQDILAIEEQIGILREEIESAEGKLELYDDRIAWSTLKVSYYVKTNVSIRFSRHFQNGFQNGWRNLVWLLVGIVNVWPFWLILILVGFAIRNQRKRKKDQLKAETQTPPDNSLE